MQGPPAALCTRDAVLPVGQPLAHLGRQLGVAPAAEGTAVPAAVHCAGSAAAEVESITTTAPAAERSDEHGSRKDRWQGGDRSCADAGADKP
jgi:hypothetical protein